MAHAPFVVVNAAAYTAVDKAEEDREEAFAVNREGAGHAARAARLAGAPIIHFSTDYVYSGDKPDPYVESDPTGPASVYGQSKLEGEKLVIEENPDHFILRTAWVYSVTGKNFLKSMLAFAEQRDVLTIVNDQFGNPSHADDLANGMFQIVRKIAENGPADLAGLYHLSGPERMNWADFSRHILAISKSMGGPFAEVEDIPSSQYPTAARRPRNSSLDCTRFRERFDFENMPFHSSVSQCVATLLNRQVDERKSRQ